MLCIDDEESVSDAAADNESNDEVDVVSVSSSRRPDLEASSTSWSRRPVSVVRELLVLPPACSLLARVTAMHSYSSSATHQYTPPSSTAAATIYSAPQSPAAVPARHGGPDRRCISTPASPSPATRTSGRLVRRSCRRRKAARGSDSSASSDDDGADCGDHHVTVAAGGKRAYHNVLERRRRDDLKYSFEALRAVVDSGDVHRIPKVVILGRARDHVRQLKSTWQRLSAEYSRLKCLHEHWTRQLSLVTERHHSCEDRPACLHAAA